MALKRPVRRCCGVAVSWTVAEVACMPGFALDRASHSPEGASWTAVVLALAPVRYGCRSRSRGLVVVRESRTCLQPAATLDSQSLAASWKCERARCRETCPGGAVSLSRPALRAVSAGASLLSAACARCGPSLYSAATASAQVTYCLCAGLLRTPCVVLYALASDVGAEDKGGMYRDICGSSRLAALRSQRDDSTPYVAASEPDETG